MEGFFYTNEFYLSIGLGILGIIFLIFLIFFIFKKPKPNKFDPVMPKGIVKEKKKDISSDKKITEPVLMNNKNNFLQSPKKYQRTSFR
ncbi:MAG: hypothetical protein WC260_00350 [Candidatus Pacearchaeota archaeon]